MRLNKRGQRSVDGKVVGLIVGVIGVVIFLTAAPTLWTILDTALTQISTAGIPLVSGMTDILGLVFGAVILLGGLFYLFKQLSTTDR
jgi:phage-related minor tail protein